MDTPTSLFSAHWYLTNNPKLAPVLEAGTIEPFTHFALYGKYEDRSPGPLFSPKDYLELNPDVAAAVAKGETTAYDHFVMYGFGEGRSPLKFFDEHFYLERNLDVAEAVAAGAVSAVQHFLLYGHSEMRAISPLIDLRDYVAANHDVYSAVESGALSALEHLLLYGIREGRELGNGVRLADFSDDTEFNLALAIGNVHAALERVSAVAPFMPDFRAPADWTPPADTVIPLDFTPPDGWKLVIPDGILVPDGMRLPETFEPVVEPPQSHGHHTSTAGHDAAGRPFVLSQDTDQLLGTRGNDTFTAAPGTLTEADHLDGRAGTDVLIIEGPNSPAWDKIKNIETLRIVNPGDVDIDAGAAGFESVTASAGGKVSITGGRAVVVEAASGDTVICGQALSSVSIANVAGAVWVTNNEAGTLRAVTLENLTGKTATLTGDAIEEISISRQLSDLTVDLHNGKSTSLLVNIQGQPLDPDVNAVAVKIQAGELAQSIRINAAEAHSHVDITAKAAKTIEVIGAGDLSLGNIVSSTLSAIDGSKATGALTVDLTDMKAAKTLVAGGLTIHGGSSHDIITLPPGVHGTSSTETAKGYTLTGGGGRDTFDVSRVIAFNDAGKEGAKSVVNADFAVITTITDFSAGDVLKFDSTHPSTGAEFHSKAINVSHATSLTAALELAASPTEHVTWFRYGSDTYVLVDGGTSNDFTRSDIIVKLTGHIDLSAAVLEGGMLSLAVAADISL